MIRVAHISDSHFDERGRLEDVIEVHRAFLRQAAAAQVDVIVHAGDWFERRSTPAERNAVADFLQEAARIATVFGVKGNHDQKEDLSIFNRLEVTHENSVQIVEPRWHWDGIPTQGGPVYLIGIPWFDKAHVASKVAAEEGTEVSRRLTIEAAGLLLDGIRAQIAEWKKPGREGPAVIVVGHLMVAGSETSTGQVLQGITVEIAPADLLELGASYVALGHIHKRQEWFGGRVAYSGSPHRCNFGEPEAKGWNLITLDENGAFKSNEFRELPARRMVRIERDWTETVGQGDDAVASHAEMESARDALVRWRVRIRAEDLALLDKGMVERFLLGAGAAEVQVEAVVETQARARAPEIVVAQSVSDKVRAYMKSKGSTEDEARVLEKVADLEREVAGA